jgi:hypothetical protein
MDNIRLDRSSRGVMPVRKSFGDVMKLIRSTLVFVAAMVFSGGLTGCAGDGAKELTPSAMVDLNGTEPMRFKAPADGQVNVYDVTINDLLYSGLIHKNEEIVVDPMAKTIRVNNQVASSRPLYGGDTLKIQFDENK